MHLLPTHNSLLKDSGLFKISKQKRENKLKDSKIKNYLI